MKYVIAWKTRLTGSERENEQAARRGIELFSKYEMPSQTTFHQFLGRLDGTGGFAVVETDDPAEVLDGVTKFGPLNEFEVHPVMDYSDWLGVAQEGVAFRESIS